MVTVRRKKKQLSDRELIAVSLGVPIGTGVAVVASQRIATSLGQNISPAVAPLIPAAGLLGTIGLTGLAVRQLRRIEPRKRRIKKKK